MVIQNKTSELRLQQQKKRFRLELSVESWGLNRLIWPKEEFTKCEIFWHFQVRAMSLGQGVINLWLDAKGRNRKAEFKKCNNNSEIQKSHHGHLLHVHQRPWKMESHNKGFIHHRMG